MQILVEAVVVAVLEGVEEEGHVAMLHHRVLRRLPPQLLASKWHVDYPFNS